MVKIIVQEEEKAKPDVIEARKSHYFGFWLQLMSSDARDDMNQ